MIAENGLVRFNGASNYEDSPVAAALALLFNMPLEINHNLYFNNYLYQRCPNAIYSVSRDQYIAIAAIIYLKEKNNNDLKALVDTSRVNGNDLLFVIGGHTRICKGAAPSWIQDKMFKISLSRHATKTPLDELNQLLIMMMVHPDSTILKWYCKMNPMWDEAIRVYFYGWRDEKELAEHMIKVINALIV